MTVAARTVRAIDWHAAWRIDRRTADAVLAVSSVTTPRPDARRARIAAVTVRMR
jgi:hypothetical protein